MRTCNALAQHGRRGRLHGNHLDVRVLALQILAHAGDGAAGADAGHKNVHLAIGILPDLGAGGLDVCLRVGRVHELAGDEGIGDLLCQLICLGNGTLHTLCAFAEHQFCTIGLHQLAALHAHGLGHHDDDAVALGCRHSRQTDAGVAGGGLDDDGAFLQQALFLGIIDHLFGDAVLDGTSRIEVFQLGNDMGRQLLLLFDVGQLQQRSMTDQLICGSINLAHCSFLPDTVTGTCALPDDPVLNPLYQHCLWV